MPDIVLDKAKNALAAFIKAVVGGAIVAGNIDFLAMYACTVVSQNADGSSTQSGTLELKPDDPRLGPGFSRIPLRLGLPGVVVTLSTPTRCLIGWYGGDRTKPFAALFEGSTVSEIDVTATTIKLNGGTNGVARNGDSVQVTLTALEIANITAPSGGGPCTGGPINISGTIQAGSAGVKCG